ncbi:FMN-dependent NADH:quinone oxidoreductase-like [Montipora capricornis]|uniref:FMN-dependent NADH:quinone oxidoreductase-like n=1 Tax=Montipora capricornis TaxID=246305 RepID=UPI0035F18486
MCSFMMTKLFFPGHSYCHRIFGWRKGPKVALLKPNRHCSFISAFSGEIKSSEDLQKGSGNVQILHLNSSGSDMRSWTGIASRTFLRAYRSKNRHHVIKEVNLWDKNLLQYDLSHVASKMRMVTGDADQTDKLTFEPVEQMIKTLFSAHKLVVSSPMWNYSIPYVLKQYIDCVVQPGLTFRETPDGPEGLFTGRSLMLITSSGGDYSTGQMKALDYQVPYLKDIFGLIGFTDIRHIYIKNTAHTKKDELMRYVQTSCLDEAGRF